MIVFLNSTNETHSKHLQLHVI